MRLQLVEAQPGRLDVKREQPTDVGVVSAGEVARQLARKARVLVLEKRLETAPLIARAAVAQPVKEDDSPLAMVRQLSLSKMMEMENSKVGAVQSVKSVAKAPLKTQAYLLCIVSVVIAMCTQLYFGQKVAGGPSRDAHLLPGAGCLIMLAALKDKLSQK